MTEQAAEAVNPEHPALPSVVTICTAAANRAIPSRYCCLEIMRQEGIDLSKPRRLEFYLLFPSREVAASAVPAVVAEGYEAQVCGGPGSPQPSIVARKVLLPTKAELLAVRKQLVTLSRKYGGTYQGCFPRA